MENLIKIGITHGDFNGIGYEVILKTLADERCRELFTPIIYGTLPAWNYYRKGLGIDSSGYPLRMIDKASDAVDGEINFIEVNDGGREVLVQHGKLSAMAGELARKALIMVRQDLMDGKIDAVVTAPICKEVISSEAFPFVGHTGFFAEPFKGTHQPMMLFVAEEIRVALLTIHEPLGVVPTLITKERLKAGIAELERSLQQDFGIEKPRIAVMGLNPHAGENGLLGCEEVEMIAPTVEEAWQEGIHAFGPFAADGFWGSGQYEKFDAILAMYHDQGLLPFKLLAMEAGVNVTVGLPIIRTSPDHGTAFDICGKGVANETSFRHAIYRAIDIYRHRARYEEATANPLQKRYVDRGKDNVRLDLSKSDDEL